MSHSCSSTTGFGIVLSLAVGSKSIPFGTVFESFTSFDSSLTDHLIVRELRLPRTVLAVMVGAALGVAGALMQGVTRNPLADPGLLGVNAGAAFAVVFAIWAFEITDVLGLVWFAFVGAAITSVLVYVLGSMGRGGANPVRLALAGAALSALLGAFIGAITLLDQATLDQYRFWAVGSLSGRDTDRDRPADPLRRRRTDHRLRGGTTAERTRPRRGSGPFARHEGEHDAGRLGARDHAALRRRRRGLRTDRLRRPRGPARRARVVRARPAVADAGIRPRRCCAPALLRHRRTHRGPSRPRSRSAS